MRYLKYLFFLVFFQLEAQQSLQEDALAILGNDDKKILFQIEKSLKNKNWTFEKDEINYYLNKVPQLENIYLLYKNQPSSFRKTALEFYLGLLNYYNPNHIIETRNHLTEAYKNSSYLSNDQKMRLLYTLGDTEKALSNNVNSIYFYNKELDLALKTKNEYEQYRAYRELGVNYRDIGEFDLARRNLFKAIDFQNKMKLPEEDKVWMNLHIGRLYRVEKKYDLSGKYYLKALKNKHYRDFIRVLPQTLAEYTAFWEAQKNIDSTRFYSLKHISIIENQAKSEKREVNKMMYDLLLPQSCISIGNTYLWEHNKEKALEYYKKAFQIGKKTNQILLSVKAAKLIVKNSTPNDPQYVEALHFIFHSFNQQKKDLQNTIKFTDQFIQLKKYDNDKERQKVKEHYRNLFYITSALFLMILSVILSVFYVYHSKYKNSKKRISCNRAEYENANEKLAGKIELKNQICNTISQKYIQPINIILDKIKSQSEDKYVYLYEFDYTLKMIKYQLNKAIQPLLETREVTKQVVSVKSIFNHAIADLRELIANNQTSVKLNVKENITIDCVEILIKNLFRNLIEFAIIHSDSEKHLPLTIVAFKKKNKVTIQIIDNKLGTNKSKQIEILEIINSRYKKKAFAFNKELDYCRSVISHYNGSIKFVPRFKEGSKLIIHVYEQ